jgi:hypothetical protein
MDCLCVCVVVESFWSSLNLKDLSLITRTSKMHRLTCDLVFAVGAMPHVQDKKITKAWARRWLGLSEYWLYLGAELTLLKALEILKEHGGLACNQKRALRFRSRTSSSK